MSMSTNHFFCSFFKEADDIVALGVVDFCIFFSPKKQCSVHCLTTQTPKGKCRGKMADVHSHNKIATMACFNKARGLLCIYKPSWLVLKIAEA